MGKVEGTTRTFTSVCPWKSPCQPEEQPTSWNTERLRIGELWGNQVSKPPGSRARPQDKAPLCYPFCPGKGWIFEVCCITSQLLNSGP